MLKSASGHVSTQDFLIYLSKTQHFEAANMYIKILKTSMILVDKRRALDIC